MNTFASQLDGASLIGRKVIGYSPDLYRACLLFEGKETLGFTVEEHSAGDWFEVFTLQGSLDLHERQWTLFSEPLSIESSAALWRTEWLEEGASGLVLGTRPKTHYAGRGPAPQGAVAAAYVQAGLLLHCSNGHLLFAAASATSPFGVDILVDRLRIQKLLEDFEPIESEKRI